MKLTYLIDTAIYMNIIKKAGIIASIFLLFSTAYGQELRSYNVTCDPFEFDYLISHPEENNPINCSFEYDSQTWVNVSLCLYDSPYSTYPKKSFMIDFDDADPFLERDIVNLKAQWSDPTFSREYLAYDLFDRAGLATPRTWFARLYVNGDYMGLYLDVEEVDESFLTRAGLAEGSSIYKADTIGCLLTPDEPVEDIWEKLTNTNTGYYDLIGLINWLENVHEYQFIPELLELFQQDNLLRTLAINALLGNHRTYYDNYILINDLNQDGFWRILPGDLDSTFIYSPDFDDPQYYNCGHPLLSRVNTLAQRCWRHPQIQGVILNHASSIIDSFFTEVYYQGATSALETLLYDAVLEDTYKQFTINDFTDGLADIPGQVAGRGDNLEYRSENEPLPFDLNPALLTPQGIYFSWDSTSIENGSSPYYMVEIDDDSLFSGFLTWINVASNLNLLYDELDPGSYYWRVFASNPANDFVRSLTFYSTFEVPENAFNGTEITEPISSNTIWDVNGSPYSLPEGLLIEEGAVLTIEPGVLIGIGTGQSIKVQGSLEAIGTSSDSIRFVPLNPDSTWGALLIDNDAVADISFTTILKGNIDSLEAIFTPYYTIQVGIGAQFNVYDSHIYGDKNLSSNDWYKCLRSYCGAINFERVHIDQFWDHINAHHGSLILRSCKLTNCFFENIDFEGSTTGGEVSYCEIYGGGGDGVDIDNIYNFNINNNFITSMPDKGISIGGNTDNINTFNNIATNCQIGISVKTSSNATVYNNVVAYNDTGYFSPTGGPGGRAVIRNSVFWGNEINIMDSLIVNGSFEYCLIHQPDPYPGQGNINSDPQFIDGWNGNFYPLSTSPLIDAGYGTGHPELDLLNQPRIDIPSVPNTGGGGINYVDIGVYEYREGGPGVESEPAQPQDFVLLENYPNPFNSVTHINFSLVSPGWAEISIFDILGHL